MSGPINGITVTLISFTQTGTDDFNRPITSEVKTNVDNVLVSPASSDDVTNTLNLTGKKAVYNLAIPKGDAHDWENALVEFFDKRWRVVGIPVKGIEAMIPLDWNEKVTVEMYEQSSNQT